MKFTSIGKAFVVTAAAASLAVGMTACGNDNTSGTSSSSASGSSAECGGKNALTAEGSTAQQNAIAEFNKAWGQVCAGKNLSYNGTGSGAGRQPPVSRVRFVAC